MRLFRPEVRRPSVLIAKERLKSLLNSDRTSCTPDTYERMCEDLFRTISKYQKVTEEFFDVKVTRSKIYITLSGEKL